MYYTCSPLFELFGGPCLDKLWISRKCQRERRRNGQYTSRRDWNGVVDPTEAIYPQFYRVFERVPMRGGFATIPTELIVLGTSGRY